MSKRVEIAMLDREELVQGILDLLNRSYPSVESPGVMAALVEFFRALDEPTLRAVAYQTGAFEPVLEADADERDDSSSSAGGAGRDAD